VIGAVRRWAHRRAVWHVSVWRVRTAEAVVAWSVEGDAQRAAAAYRAAGWHLVVAAMLAVVAGGAS